MLLFFSSEIIFKKKTFFPFFTSHLSLLTYVRHLLFPPFLSIFTFHTDLLFPSSTSSPPISCLPLSFSFCLTQEAVISKRSVLADIFHGTSLISTTALLLANRSCLHFPPIPLNQEASQPTDPRVNQLQIAFSVVWRSCLL